MGLTDLTPSKDVAWPPAAHYSAERMAQRLQELAENPMPTPESVAREFGVQWRTVTHRANATDHVLTDYQAVEVARPLRLRGPATPNSSSVALRDWGAEQSLSLAFDVAALCVPNFPLEARLSTAPWKPRKHKNPLGGHPAIVFYETVREGQVINVDVRGTGCLESITITRYRPGFQPEFSGEEERMTTPSGLLMSPMRLVPHLDGTPLSSRDFLG
jgi:hypothetical protein